MASGRAALQERHESLWRIVVSPLAWAAHFLLCYVTAAIWCAKYAAERGALGPVHWLIAAYTLVALAVIAFNGVDGLRRHRHDSSPLPHDADTPADRYRFLGFVMLLLASLSAVATVFTAIAALYFQDCR